MYMYVVRRGNEQYLLLYRCGQPGLGGRGISEEILEEPMPRKIRHDGTNICWDP